MEKKKYTLKDFFSNLFWAFKWVFSFSKFESFLLFATYLIRALIPIASSYLFALMLTTFTGFLAENSPGFYSLLTRITPIALIYLVVNLIQSLNENANFYLKSKLNIFYDNQIYLEVYKKISTIDFEKHEDAKFNDKIKKATENIDRVTSLYDEIFVLISNAVGVIGSSLILLKFHPFMLLFVIIFSMPSTVLQLKSTLRRRKMYESMVQLNRSFWYASENLTTDKQLYEVRANNLSKRISDYMQRKMDIKNEKEFGYYKDYAKKSSRLAIFDAQDILFGLMIMQKILVSGGTIGDLSFYWGRATNVTSLIRNTLTSLVFLFDRSKVLEYVRDIMEFENCIKTGEVVVSSKMPPKIEFDKVSFKYPGSSKYVLKDLSIVLNPFDEVALVGLNGAGKTTLIKLLLRFYDPTSGVIKINGTPLSQIDLLSYYSVIGILFQDFNKYPFLTIKESLLLNKTRYSHKSIEEALDFSDILDTVKSLPKKAEHRLSKWFTNGMNFSKGQEQKLALARIIFRNAPLLILDEPTSSIDSNAEFKIFNKIYKSFSSKTIVVISHRFNTIRSAKKIYVLKNGRIVEEGNHDELMAKQGQYYKSFNLQAEGYKSISSTAPDQVIQTA
ncbi:MAG: ABC transporter, ATP-binding/permease protein [candidate division WS6 bacterium GW2011_GWF2_39_15]|uniref:ABC transporter, ATP-binding/permease protein n=1 Tax=candidate division WS6 bacterium GW2011_GWF2_39_15 TaxID=1619100 RepID=A0A0G0Q592_9BACT|nr:MAG: ABC transporter, ATP-binding/permease protein [candidate division WS6 bacterium GW2011_GWF2_39_15]